MAVSRSPDWCAEIACFKRASGCWAMTGRTIQRSAVPRRTIADIIRPPGQSRELHPGGGSGQELASEIELHGELNDAMPLFFGGDAEVRVRQLQRCRVVHQVEVARAI